MAVIRAAYANAVTTRKLEQLVNQLGITSPSESHVSRLCGEVDVLVEGFGNRPLSRAYPYLWVDARSPNGANGGAGGVRGGVW